MDENKDELQQAEPEQEEKQSVKDYLKERMAALESGEIPRRGPGRPRKYPEGRKYQSRITPDSDALSIARSEAGKKAQANRQSIIQTEASRKKWGRVRQAELDTELAALDGEMATYQWAEGMDQADTKEFVQTCALILSDFIWQRKYPQSSDAMWDEFEVPTEEKRVCRGWPEHYMRDLLTMSRYVLARDRPGVQKLMIETATKFLEWAKDQTNKDSAFEQTIEQVKKSLPKLTDGSIFKGFIAPEDDPRQIPPKPLKSKEDQIAEYQARHRSWEAQGRDIPRIESDLDRRLREDAEHEAAVLAQQEEAVARAIEEQHRQQRELLGGSYQQVQDYLSGNVFGSKPREQ